MVKQFKARKLVCIIGCAILIIAVFLFNLICSRSKSNGFRSEIVDLLEASTPSLKNIEWYISDCSEEKTTKWRTRKILVSGTIICKEDLYSQKSYRSQSEFMPAVEMFTKTDMLKNGIKFSGVIYHGLCPAPDRVHLISKVDSFLQKNAVHEQAKSSVVIVDSVVVPSSLKHMEKYEAAELRLKQSVELLLSDVANKIVNYESYCQKSKDANFDSEKDAFTRTDILNEQQDWLKKLSDMKVELNKKTSEFKSYLSLPLKEIYGNQDRLRELEALQNKLQEELRAVSDYHTRLESLNKINTKFHSDVLSGKVKLLTPLQTKGDNKSASKKTLNLQQIHVKEPRMRLDSSSTKPQAPQQNLRLRQINDINKNKPVGGIPLNVKSL